MKTPRSSAILLCLFAGLASLHAGDSFAGAVLYGLTHGIDPATGKVAWRRPLPSAGSR